MLFGACSPKPPSPTSCEFANAFCVSQLIALLPSPFRTCTADNCTAKHDVAPASEMESITVHIQPHDYPRYEALRNQQTLSPMNSILIWTDNWIRRRVWTHFKASAKIAKSRNQGSIYPSGQLCHFPTCLQLKWDIRVGPTWVSSKHRI